MNRSTQQVPIRVCSHARGMTLIELVIAIAVIAIAVSSVLAVLSAQATRSADAMIREQANAIASAYLSEIMQKRFSGPLGCCAARKDFDSVDDYKSPAFKPVLDQWGNPIMMLDQFGKLVPGLNQFQVRVTISPGNLSNIPVADQVLLNVTVTHPSGVSVLLSGYRTKWP
jgi:MSHA pilin protein MshD